MNVDRFTNTDIPINWLLREEYDVFLQYSHGPTVNHWAKNYLQDKLGGNPVRAQFTAAINGWLLGLKPIWYRWQLSATKARFFQAQMPFLSEIVISIQYLHNQILDGKAGVTTHARISENLLLANLLKDQLYRYIDEEVPAVYRRQVASHIRQCFEWVDIGQQLESSGNNYHQLHQHDLADLLPQHVLTDIDLSSIQAFIDKTKQTLPRFLHQELDHYFHRIYLTCAALFVQITRLTGELLHLNTTQLHAPLQFSVCYGVMRQLVNDNADWVITKESLRTQERFENDAGSDLRKQTLTLPLFFWLANTHPRSSLIQQLLRQERDWDLSLMPKVFEEIVETQALFQAVQHTRILAELAPSFLPVEQASLASACEIAHWNKFLVPVLRHPAYQDFRQTATHRRTKRLIKQLRSTRKSDIARNFVTKKQWPWSRSTTPYLPVAAYRALKLIAQS